MPYIPNPFRDPGMRQHFFYCTTAYLNKSANLFYPDGKPQRGNGLATNFWRGYAGSIPRERWDRASRNTLAWAAYRAGEAVKKLNLEPQA